MVAIPASERQDQADPGGCRDCQVSQLGEILSQLERAAAETMSLASTYTAAHACTDMHRQNLQPFFLFLIVLISEAFYLYF